ncbi:type I polyketide synthase [Frankia sp. B2]|uniref:type I polyketide synthase n=1 Tax=unclassified Frankia TaxID=2632575 RepID=UPI00046195AE|nr:MULTISPECIES: type I polyketide synthase [unclassified Frankia]KDA43373.1 polyketide synthase family protein [Frankia sp. BMG5.23]TFE28356.1 type I polyketide synthase [Frankia sp. B2]
MPEPGAGPGGRSASGSRSASGGGAPPIALVGMAALFPGAGDLGTFWGNIVGGVDAIREVSPERFDVDDYFRPDLFRPDPPRGDRPGAGPGGVGRPGGVGSPGGASDAFYCRRGGFVEEFASFDPAAFGIMPLAVDWAEPDQLLSLRLAAEAITDAGGPERLGDAERVGVVLGRGGYVGPGVAKLEQRVRTSRQIVTTLREILPDLPAEAVERVREAFVAQLGPQRPEASIGLVPNLAASRIANRLDLRGPAYTVDGACASSLIAVDMAMRDLGSGRTDAMIVGGAHIVHEASFWSVFTLLRALSPSEIIRPFDRRADGILIGEGVGMVVLKRLADAERDGDRIYAVLRGSGTSSDGRSASLMAPAVEGQTLAVRRAWADAGLDPTAPGAIGLVEAHGTATPTGDAVELATLSRIFGTASGGPAGPGRADIGIGSVKSMIGHAMPAAGAAALIKTALALHHRVLPPTLHCDEPHPAFVGSRFAPVRAVVEWDAPAGGGPRRAGVNAFGFGGINAHLVLEEAPAPAAVTAARTFAAPAVTTVDRAADPDVGPDVEPVLLFAGADAADLLAQLDVPDAELLARDDAATPPTGGPWRLALVAPTARRLALARTVVERGTPWRGRNDLWFTPAGMFAPARAGGDSPAQTAFLFCGLEDKFTPRIDDVCEHFGLTKPTLDDTGMLGRHGVASVEVGRILDVALRRLGIIPDLVGGHSIGEWNAMISCGLITDEYTDDFLAGFDPTALEVPGVVFGALGCGAQRATEVIAGLDEVVVSHDNCPHQSIICGREDSVRTTLDRLRRDGVLGQILPFRSGFHSPFLEPYLDPMRARLARTTFVEASVPIWSATTVAPYPSDHDAIRALALRHLVEPVRFRQLVERLRERGVRAFIQVGVGSVAGFVDDTLPGNDHLSLVTNTVKRPGLDQLRRVAAAMWAEGAAPRMDLLPCRSRPAPAVPPLPRAANGPHRVGAPVRLSLGTPLIRLGGGAGDLLNPGSADRTHRNPPAWAEGDVPTHPVIAELRAALAEADAVMSTVVDRWSHGATPARVPPPGSGGRAIPGDAIPGGVRSGGVRSGGVRGGARFRADDAPRGGGTSGGAGGNGDAGSMGVPPRRGASAADGGAAGRGTGADRTSAVGWVPVPRDSPEPGPRMFRRRLSLASMPHIVDHCFYRQPPGWADISDLFPVVPMTEVLELMIGEAAALLPGRVPVGVRDVRALRWLAIEPAVEVSIALAPAGPDAVRVTVDGYARGTVLFAADHLPPPESTAITADLSVGRTGPTLPVERPPRHRGRDLYGARFLFHGPGYQGIHRIEAIAPTGIRGRLRVPSASGALLDNVGQLFGYWAMEHLSDDSLLLPQSLADVQFHGPAPVEGDLVDCVVRIRQVAERTVTADMEVRRADGRVWAVITGWTDRRFANDDVLWAMVRAPELNTVAQPSGEGWVVAVDRWPDAASRELIVRHYADAAERARLAALNPRAARGRLLGRIAAQDAVRRWLWERGAGPVWGIEVGIRNDDVGAPVITSLPARPGVPAFDPPGVSLAHKPELAVALVAADGEVGIDLERIVSRAAGVEKAALAPTELRLLDRVAGTDPHRRAVWFTRLWAAKEAAAKADGTGLAGRPRRFVVDGPHPFPGKAHSPGRDGLASSPVGGTPPDLVRVTVYGDGPDGSVPERTRWVALRTVDAAGRIQPEPTGPAPREGGVSPSRRQDAVGDDVSTGRVDIATVSYVVAWTSPEVEAHGLQSQKEC